MISIIGEVTAEAFTGSFKSVALADPVARAYFSKLERAAVIRGTPEGRILEEVSLLDG